MLSANGLACGYGTKTIVEGVTLSLTHGEVLCLLGPNGAGKTTLFRTLLGLQPALRGDVRLDGRALGAWQPRALAQRLGYVPQAHIPAFPFRVADMVAMGRAPHLHLFATPGPADWKEVDTALEAVGVSHLRERAYNELSGGEQRLVLIARVLAQRSSILLLDEPTANLDYGNQIRFMRTVRTLAGLGYGILMTTHMPEHAFQCATSVLALFGGRVQAQGTPQEVITERLLRRMYGEIIRISPHLETSGAAMPAFQVREEFHHAATN